MTEKSLMNVEARLAELARVERDARPTPSETLVARVLGDAAEVAASFAPKSVPGTATRGGKAGAGGGWRWLRGFGISDAWSGGAAVAAVLLFLVLGFGFGYQAGATVLADFGLTNTVTTQVAQSGSSDSGDMLFPSDEVL